MPFPTEFPSDAAATIGKAWLAKQYDLSLMEPAYDLQGYAEHMLFGGGGPFPKPVLKSAPEPGLHEDDVARRLVIAAESAEDGHNVRALPIPWSTVLSLVLTIVQQILANKGA